MRTLVATLRAMKVGSLILLTALCGAGCAKIGEPQPPEVLIPERSRDLAARQSSDFVVVTVSKPQRNTDGSEATTLERVDLLRLTAEPGDSAAKALPEEQFIQEASRIFSVPASRFAEYLNDTTFVFQDRLSGEKSGMYSRAFWYAVLFVNNKNQSAGLGNRVSVTPVRIPPPPDGLTAETKPNYIQLGWTAPTENMDGLGQPEIEGYNIYRTEEPGKFPSEPINQDPVRATEFQDSSFQFDATYYYAVTTVGSAQESFPESLLSSGISITPRDIFPPEPPADFSAMLRGEEVLLLWSPSPSADVAGYRIYRVEPGTTGRQLLQTDLIRGLSFRDSQQPAGKVSEYQILAVDTHGNNSRPITAERAQ